MDTTKRVGEKSAEDLAGADTSCQASECDVFPDRDWTDEEEARSCRKVDATVLPLLCVGFLVFQFDRMNLASALTDGFADYIGINQSTINLGNNLLFLGTVALEIPSNMLLQKIGPRKWLSFQVLLFGFVGIMQIFIRNRAGYIASRLCLGLAESGYIPGSIYTVSTWYTKKERARRVAIFFFGMFGGNAISPLFASGILKLGGVQGLKGWQWLFLIEGIITLCISMMFFFLLPGSPENARPLAGRGIVRFTDRESYILQKRLERDNERRLTAKGMHIPLRVVWKTVKHWRRWPHFVSTFCVFSTWSPLTTYTPSIVMSLGFDRISANALSAVGGALALVVVFIFAYVSDRTNQRGISVMAAQLCYLVVLIVARSIHSQVGKWPNYVLWTVINTFAVGYHPVHNTWLQLNCREPEERSISIAMWVMSANTGMMVGTWYYRADDKPSFYNNGLRTQIIMVGVGFLAALVQEVLYRVHNRRVVEGRHEVFEGKESRVYVP
ncbi:inner membrane transporter yfaV [Coniochaeta sp. PMI_546]|nr:inner membrane transporter yfaV [Coniochaeta sp. PMI_546]